MNTSERNLLTESDRMTESMLVRLEDWELAHLRVAMLHELEEALSTALLYTSDNQSTFANNPARKVGVASGASSTLQRRTKPRPSGRGCGASDVSKHTSRELVEVTR